MSVVGTKMIGATHRKRIAAHSHRPGVEAGVQPSIDPHHPAFGVHQHRDQEREDTHQPFHHAIRDDRVADAVGHAARDPSAETETRHEQRDHRADGNTAGARRRAPASATRSTGRSGSMRPIERTPQRLPSARKPRSPVAQRRAGRARATFALAAGRAPSSQSLSLSLSRVPNHRADLHAPGWPAQDALRKWGRAAGIKSSCAPPEPGRAIDKAGRESLRG